MNLNTLSLVTLVEYINKKYNISNTNLEHIDVHTDNLISNYTFSTLELNNNQLIDDFPPTCKNIFTPYIQNIRRHSSINIYDCILTCLQPKYTILPENSKIQYIDILRNKMILDLLDKKLYRILGYPNSRSLSESLKNNIINRPTVKYFSDYFNINIFVISIVDDKISAVYSGEIFDKHIPSIFVSYYDDKFEPLSFDYNFIWNGSPCYNKIITTDLNIIHKWDNSLDDIVIGEISLDPYIVVYDENNKFSHRMGELIYRSNLNRKSNIMNDDAANDYYTENPVS